MALVEWASGFDGKTGKYIGSAFGLSSTGITLFRNPTVARKQRQTQDLPRQTFSMVQREYRNLSENDKLVLAECARNNPYVNSRGVVSFGNRYLKWLQIGTYQVYAGEDFPLIFYPDAAQPMDLSVQMLVVTITPASGTGLEQLSAGWMQTLNSTYREGVVMIMYMSRPVSAGVTHYYGNWTLFAISPTTTMFDSFSVVNNLWSRPYQVGDNIIIRIDVIDMYRASLLTVQMIPWVITQQV